MSTQKIQIGEKVFQVPFPTVSQIMEIESLKNILSNGSYSIMARSNLVQTRRTLDLIDAISHFKVLIPDIKENLEFDKMPLKDGIKLVVVYQKQFLPWYEKILDELYTETSEPSLSVG